MYVPDPPPFFLPVYGQEVFLKNSLVVFLEYDLRIPQNFISVHI